jgi:hypothetical protein
VTALASRLGHGLREVKFRVAGLWAGKGPSVMIFPGGPPGGTAAGLRGWALAPPLRALGFRVSVVPPQLERRSRERLVTREKPDFIILQKCRDPLNDPALFPEIPCILDMDDADFLHPGAEEKVARIARQCAAAVAGSQFVEQWLRLHCSVTRVIWTGSPYAASPIDHKRGIDSKAVVFAVSDVLGYPREAEFVRDVMLACGPSSGARLRVIGKGDERTVRAVFSPLEDAGIPVELEPWQPYERLLRSLSDCAVGLAPLDVKRSPYSRGKSFGKVLAYLSSGEPVVCSDVAEHPHFFRSGINGFSLPNDPDLWSRKICALMDTPLLRERLVQAAADDFRSRLSTARMAEEWADLLRTLATLPKR